MNNIKYILFDLYDTLIFTAKKNNSYYHLFRDFGFNKNQRTDAKNIALTNNFENLEEYLRAISQEKHRTIDVEKYGKLIQEEVNSTKVFDDTIQVLHELKSDGYKIGLISNLATPFTIPFFDVFYIILDNTSPGYFG